MSYLDLVVGEVVARLLVENWVAPAVDRAGFEEVFTSFEFDGKFLFSSLKAVSKLVHKHSKTRGMIHFFLILVAVGGRETTSSSYRDTGNFVLLKREFNLENDLQLETKASTEELYHWSVLLTAARTLLLIDNALLTLAVVGLYL